jgi:hypothetical protein
MPTTSNIVRSTAALFWEIARGQLVPAHAKNSFLVETMICAPS